MISGSFHTSAQEWRYYSREKSLIHTLHLAQLSLSRAGDTVLILSGPQVASNQGHGFSGPPFQMPTGPYGGVNPTQVTNNSMVIDCYGATNCNQEINAQKNMSIQIGPIGGALSQIILEPGQSGYFVVHAECYSEIHQLGSEGPAGDGQITLSILNGGVVTSQAVAKAKMEGADWTSHTNWVRRMQASTSCLVSSAGQFKILAENLGDGCLTAWAMKVADYD